MRTHPLSFVGVPGLILSHPLHKFLVQVSSKSGDFFGRVGVFKSGRFGQFPNDGVERAKRSRVPSGDAHKVIENNFHQDENDKANVCTNFNDSSQRRGFLLIQSELHHWQVDSEEYPRKANDYGGRKKNQQRPQQQHDGFRQGCATRNDQVHHVVHGEGKASSTKYPKGPSVSRGRRRSRWQVGSRSRHFVVIRFGSIRFDSLRYDFVRNLWEVGYEYEVFNKQRYHSARWWRSRSFLFL
mmetsp:Transcript_32266/g.75874  ORF Transcript_32266/g.75874 Transcript_32266/m.75874 type:complete len:240 (-) Transcript_32266:80-799(-)